MLTAIIIIGIILITQLWLLTEEIKDVLDELKSISRNTDHPNLPNT